MIEMDKQREEIENSKVYEGLTAEISKKDDRIAE